MRTFAMLLLALTLVACSGEGADVSTDSPPSTAASESAAAMPDGGDWVPEFATAADWAAALRGAGVDCELDGEPWDTGEGELVDCVTNSERTTGYTVYVFDDPQDQGSRVMGLQEMNPGMDVVVGFGWVAYATGNGHEAQDIVDAIGGEVIPG